jgi:hypothetical protein
LSFSVVFEASSILHEMELQSKAANSQGVLARSCHRFQSCGASGTQAARIKCLYGDVAHVDPFTTPTFSRRKSSLARSPMLFCGEPRICGFCARLDAFAQTHRSSRPQTIFRWRSSYTRGADFVYIARLHSARQMAD